MENSISLRIGTKNQQVSILIGFLSGAMIFVIKLCWMPIIQTILGNQIGPDDQPALLGFLYRNLYWVPWLGALCLIVYGFLKKKPGKSLAYMTGLIFFWVVFLLGIMVFFVFWGWKF